MHRLHECLIRTFNEFRLPILSSIGVRKRSHANGAFHPVCRGWIQNGITAVPALGMSSSTDKPKIYSTSNMISLSARALLVGLGPRPGACDISKTRRSSIDSIVIAFVTSIVARPQPSQNASGVWTVRQISWASKVGCRYVHDRWIAHA